MKGRELLIDLVLLDIMDFDVILGIDWLSLYYATLDCHSKVVIFKISGEEEFKFLGDRSFAPHNLISAIMSIKILKKGRQGYLALVRDTATEQKSISSVLIAFEFLDVFLDELLGLPPHREIEFCIDMTLGTTPISMPPYRMAPTELKELKEQLQELLDKDFIRLARVVG